MVKTSKRLKELVSVSSTAELPTLKLNENNSVKLVQLID
jgi:hypothetical protein